MLYFPVALVITICFSVFTVVYAPIAFVCHVWNLFCKMYGDKCLRNLVAFVSFVILGLPILVLTSILDIPDFFENLYTEQVDDSMNSRLSLLRDFDRVNFTRFIEVIDLLIEEIKEKVQVAIQNEKDTEHLMTHEGHYILPFIQFNKRLSREFDIVNEVSKILFFETDVEVYQKNEYSGKQQLNPQVLSRMKQFSLLKRVVHNCADERGIFDLSLMKQFTNQVLMHEELFAMISKYRFQVPEDFKFSKRLHSFLVLRPREIVMCQSSTHEVLTTMTQQLIKLTEIAERQTAQAKKSDLDTKELSELTATDDSEYLSESPR